MIMFRVTRGTAWRQTTVGELTSGNPMVFNHPVKISVVDRSIHRSEGTTIGREIEFERDVEFTSSELELREIKDSPQSSFE